MAAIDRIIELGRIAEGGKADPNILMDRLPSELAKIKENNLQREERADIRADANDKWEQNHNLQKESIDYGKDGQTNTILAGMPYEAQKAAYPHFQYHTEQGKADGEAIMAGGQGTFSINETSNQMIKNARQEFQNPNTSLEEKENTINEISSYASLHNIDLKNNDSYNKLNENFTEDKTHTILMGSMEDIVKDDVNVGSLVQILSNPNLSDDVKKQWLNNSVKKDLLANDIIALTKVIEVSQPTLEGGLGNPSLLNWAENELLKRGGFDMTDYVSINQYKSTISDKSVSSLVKEVLDQKENKGATQQEALQLLIDNGIIVKNQ
tara:strand:+ start:3982 stop:4953 length:972 start_codon:yes stop_codon:yes gene_type:complete